MNRMQNNQNDKEILQAISYFSLSAATDKEKDTNNKPSIRVLIRVLETKNLPSPLQLKKCLK